MPSTVYTVWYADGSCRDVIAAGPLTALAVARMAARATGRRGPAARPVRALRLGEVGYGATDPMPRPPDGSQHGGAEKRK